MAFVLKQSETFVWPVTFEIPNECRHEKQTFDGEFKRLPQSKVGQMVAELNRFDEVGDLDNITEMARDVLVGWSGVQDGKGNEIPFSQKALNEMLEIPLLAASILRTYFDSIKGGKRKN